MALSVAGVVFVFKDPRLDHRMVAAGSLAPIVIDVAVGSISGFPTRVGPGHSMVVHVVWLAVVMLGTIGRRPMRKRLIAFSLGGFGGLVLDGAWTRTRVFSWPLTGAKFTGRQFVLDRPLAVNVLLEIVGLACLAFLIDRCRLKRPSERAAFFRSGKLEFRPRMRKR